MAQIEYSDEKKDQFSHNEAILVTELESEETRTSMNAIVCSYPFRLSYH